MATEPYCGIEDIDIGNVDMPRWSDATADETKERYILRAAEEIDAIVGQVYKLPLNLEEGSADALILKKINWMIATGRIITAASSGSEDTEMHSYGYYHIKEAEKMLGLILAGKVVLSAELKDPDSNDKQTGPLMLNRDDVSFVDSFYGSTGTMYPEGQSPWVAGLPTW